MFISLVTMYDSCRNNNNFYNTWYQLIGLESLFFFQLQLIVSIFCRKQLRMHARYNRGRLQTAIN